jgi:hypothetical protein
MESTYWNDFMGQPIYLIEEGGQYYISASDEEGAEKYWVNKLWDLVEEQPEYLMGIGSLVLPIKDFEPLLKDIIMFLNAIK